MKLGWKERPGSSRPSPAGGEVAGAEAQRVAAVGEETGGCFLDSGAAVNFVAFHCRMLLIISPVETKTVLG